MRRPRKQINQINVVPYIDVMLVLLIIFMITAPLINPGEIELPSVGQQLTTPKEALEITVKRDQSLLLRDRATDARANPVSREELLARVRQAQAADADRPVVISADKSARYETVVSVLDLLQQNKVHKVGLLARSTK
jgi:biopolymer transport protein TolR